MYFLWKAHHSLFLCVVRNRTQHFSTTLEGILNGKGIKKKHRGVKNAIHIDCEKDFGEGQQECKNVALFDFNCVPSDKHLAFSPFWHMSFMTIEAL